MYPELVTRGDLEVFLPPIGGQTRLRVRQSAATSPIPRVTLTARVHDECNGSDVFGSDICTCRPYLTHAIEECIRGAQDGGVGLVVYCRKEGRALGEVTKFLVYNARKRQQGGDRASNYFLRTECVAGVQDMRFQELMPDVLHWLGVTQDPSPGVDEQHQVRRDRRRGHRGRRARADPRRADSRPTRASRWTRRRPPAISPTASVPDAERLAHDQGPRPVTRRSRGDDAARRVRCCRRRGDSRALRQHSRGGGCRRSRATSASIARASTTAATRVEAVTRRRYPDARDSVSQPLAPFRGGRRRSQRRARRARSAGRDAAARARARIDLAVVSVLLDAGAGAAWRYVEARDRPALHALRRPRRRELSRVHGRRVLGAPRRSAARRCGGARRDRRRDARALFQVDATTIRWSASTAAPRCCGGSAARCCAARDRSARRRDPARCSTRWRARRARTVARAAISARAARRLRADLAHRQRARRRPLGDVWRHPHAGGDGPTAGWVPFHKLSQWLAYSLFEPFEWAGVHGHRPRRADRAARVPQRRPAARHRRARAASTTRDAARRIGRRQRARRRMARADRRAARRARAARARAPRRRRSCRSRASSKAAPGPRAASSRSELRGGEPPLVDPFRRHRVLRSDRTRSLRCPRTVSRVRPSAGPAQADAAAQEGDQHDELSPAAERDRLADGLRSDARHADARGRDRDAARDDDRAADRRQEARVRADPARRHGTARRLPLGRARRARRPHRPLPRSEDAGRGRVLLQDAERHVASATRSCSTRCSRPATRRSPPSSG